MGEIHAMPNDEWVHWHAYWAIEAQEAELANKRSGGG